MKPEYEAIELIDNQEAKRLEMTVDGQRAVVEYILTPDRYFLTHTEVPTTLEGRGVGTAIVEKALAFVEAAGKMLVPLCPMVAAYVHKHPEWKRLLAPGINV